ncbi:hypothetical protein Nizo1840_2749 [Lactiplantibacillus plantarum]|uniref:hypothetical protein n=1 Tax=Lactiplantibacillus TaxID=2767842 RepID=UPI0007BC3011|nr:MULTISPECIES: hypothetical protein [Lactiplantibacillus]AYC72640.1 hypothetical protein D5289_11720 [Lactiplantibacillus plantarum]KZT78832.1 hypothetical protein Nizo1840_2749 [Lactiplantibacillus plantarum]MCA5597344.1 hypothetical protein [Lactiplantibacillus argentoratensis]
MWRHRFLIKGSEQELAWLNAQAQRHYLLMTIHGNWYQFKKVPTIYRVFSEYVPQAIAADMSNGNSAFQVLAQVQVQQPDVQIVYTGSDQPALQHTTMAPTDPKVRLRVALQLRDQAMNTINLSLYAGVVVWGLFLILLLHQGDKDLIGVWMLLLLVGLLAVLGLYRTAHRLQNQISQLRRDTEQYDGAWMPTMHVFVSALTADLDTEEPALKSLGRWILVGHSKKGQYWYDLQTLASATEIKQTLRPFVATDTNVNVLSWLGLAPLGWFV